MVRTCQEQEGRYRSAASKRYLRSVCGVTEPFEFGFMFLSSPCMLFMLPVRHFHHYHLLLRFPRWLLLLRRRNGPGFPPPARSCQDLDDHSLGIAAFLVFYFVFYFAITKFDLKTPGREDDDVEESEKNIKLSNNNYTAIATGVLRSAARRTLPVPTTAQPACALK